MDLSQVILVTVVAVVMGWFALGMVGNIRRGNAALRWLQSGLPQLGERTTVRWLGSSAVELGIAKSKPPFRRVDLVLALEPRDVPWFWLLARWQGRRDLLIVRGQLQVQPKLEFDLLAPGSWSERLAHASQANWASESLDGMTFRAPQTMQALSRQAAPVALAAARKVFPQVWRLSARREFPQFELQLPWPDIHRADAGEFFSAVRRTAEALSKPATD
jgi:hypothetical protein